MKTKMHILFFGLAIALLLAACQSASSATPAASGLGGPGGGQFAQNPDFQTRIASDPDMQTRIASGGGPGGFGGQGGFGNQRATPTPTAEPIPTGTPEPTPTAVSQTAGAEKAAQNYFAALQKGDFDAASRLVSTFSLTASKLTAGDAAAALTQQKAQGAKWSDLQVKDSQVFSDRTILVHVSYQLTTLDAKTGSEVQVEKDELWPFRLESKQWRYNWDNLIDFKTLDFEVQQTAGLTVTPLQLTRYSDRIRLTVLAQNGTNEAIVIGQSNQVLATFHFAGKDVEAENTRYILDRLRSYPDVAIEVKGLFSSYPVSVDIVRWKSYQVAPWFTFTLGG